MKQNDKIDVILIKNPNEPEKVTVRYLDEMDNFYIGVLVDEPKQEFDYHKGETLAFFPFTDDRGTTIYICDMNPSAQITVEDLADGKMLEEAVSKFNENKSNDTFIDVLELLRDSTVYVPYNAVLSERDQERFEKIINEAGENLDKLVGLEFTAKDETRLIPDILENNGNYFFPIFSTEEAMGEYGDNFSKIPQSILDAITLAKNNDKKPVGIVLNAFSEPFILDKEVWDIVENMKSRLIKGNE